MPSNEEDKDLEVLKKVCEACPPMGAKVIVNSPRLIKPAAELLKASQPRKVADVEFSKGLAVAALWRVRGE